MRSRFDGSALGLRATSAAAAAATGCALAVLAGAVVADTAMAAVELGASAGEASTALDELDGLIAEATELEGAADSDTGSESADFKAKLAAARRAAAMRPYDDVWAVEDPLGDAVGRNSTLAGRAAAATEGLSDAIGELERALRERAVRDARASLSAMVDAGAALLGETGGAVDDESARDALAKRLEEGAGLRDAGSWDVDGMARAEGEIADAMAVVSASHDSWVAAREAEARAAAMARTSGAVAADGPSPSTWYAGYRGVDDRATANADGSVGEWRDGYFVAHSWSENGGMIASRPDVVNIDGVDYRYVSSIEVPRDTTWGDVSGFVQAGGGIGFQVCYGDGYLVTHYEPL